MVLIETPDCAEEVLTAQRRWLRTLRIIPPKKQILIKALEGTTPEGEDSKLYRWIRFEDVWTKTKTPFYTRGILPTEILIDPDSPDWNIVKTEIGKLDTYCKLNNIPIIKGFSGGKGIHVSIFFGEINFINELAEGLRRPDIDPYKTVRRALLLALAEKAGVDLEAMKLDWGKINFNSVTKKGTQVRMFGTTRAPGQYKTLIEEIPDHKPAPYELPLIFPDDVEIWKIKGTEFEVIAVNSLKNEVERAENSNEYELTESDFSGIEIQKFPCIQRMFEAGIKNGRYYAGLSVLLMCQKCGLSKSETEKRLRQLFSTFPDISTDDTDLRINNALEMYGQDYKFSCRQVKEIFGTDFCNFSACPVKEALDDDRNAPFNSETALEKMTKIIKSPKDSERVKQALEFIKKHVLAKEGSLTDIEIFIEEEVFKNFNIPTGKNSTLGKIFRKGYTDILKHKQKKENAKNNRKERGDDTYIISEEFDGLYKIVYNDDGTPIGMIPYIDRIADMVCKNTYSIVFNGNMFAYSDGYYKNNPYIITAEATRILNGILKNGHSNGISNHLKDVMTIVENTNLVSAYPFNEYNNAFPVKNGVIVFDWENGTYDLQDHDPEKWKFNFIVPIDYVEDADPTKIIKEFAKYVSNHRLIVQPLAQAILQSMRYGPYRALYMFKGPKGTGKTTILDAYIKFVGEICKSVVPFQELAPQYIFSKAALEGKLINVEDDMGYFKMSDTGTIKKLTGGYNHQIQRKRKDPYPGIITTVFVVTTNTPAGFDRRVYLDEAFWGRWYYVEFENTFSLNDSFQSSFFNDDAMSCILKAVIDMMILIRKKGDLLVDKSEWEQTREKWIQEGNPLHMFIKANMVEGGETPLIKEQLKTVMKKWCEDTKAIKLDALPKNLDDLNDMVEMMGGSTDKQRRFNGDSFGESHHCYILPFSWKDDNNSYKTRYINGCESNREPSTGIKVNQHRFAGN